MWKRISDYSKLAFRRMYCRRTSSIKSVRTCQPKLKTSIFYSRKPVLEVWVSPDLTKTRTTRRWEHPCLAPKFWVLRSASLLYYILSVILCQHAHCLEYLRDKLQPGSRVLDVGCGSGYLTACMAIMVGLCCVCSYLNFPLLIITMAIRACLLFSWTRVWVDISSDRNEISISSSSSSHLFC